MRNRFDEQLELLNVELIRMGALCEDAISYASRTLMKEGDFSDEVYKTDREIDQKERDIENLSSSVPDDTEFIFCVSDFRSLNWFIYCLSLSMVISLSSYQEKVSLPFLLKRAFFPMRPAIYPIIWRQV